LILESLNNSKTRIEILSGRNIFGSHPKVLIPFPPDEDIKYLDLVASTIDVKRDLENMTITFSLNIYNNGNVPVTHPFRVEISVTRRTIYGDVLANSVALLQINDQIQPSSYYTTPGNTDPLFYSDEPPDYPQYIVEALIDPDFVLNDNNRHNNYIWVKYFALRDQAMSNLPLSIKHEFKNNKWEHIY
jgi:hypothetical protein